MKAKELNPDYFRNIIFGVEDSLVSTVGVLFGVASAHYDQRLIIVTGLVVIAVEALSMGAGSYLTETSTHEISAKKHTDKPIVGGLLMFCSYFFSGFIPLAPYLLISGPNAKFASLAIGVIALFVLGYAPTKSLKGGTRMASIGGLAVVLGYIIGQVANIYL